VAGTELFSAPTYAPTLKNLGLSPDRPLVIIDVDEVLGLFMQGFGAFLESRGYEFRVERFALFQNIYAAGAAEHLDIAEGRRLYAEFFSTACDAIEPAPGAIEALNRLGVRAEILILSNAPRDAERLRARWLERLGLAHPLILNTGVKGPVTAALVAQTQARSAFVDDLLPNLDSVAEHTPQTATFQHVADERLRPLAPRSARHRRIDDWTELATAIEEAVCRP
jgi:phosphoglycolate phosphatase-like HAD superfamily hydrolase